MFDEADQTKTGRVCINFNFFFDISNFFNFKIPYEVFKNGIKKHALQIEELI